MPFRADEFLTVVIDDMGGLALPLFESLCLNSVNAARANEDVVNVETSELEVVVNLVTLRG